MNFHDVDGTSKGLRELSAAAFSPGWLATKLSHIRRFQGHPRALSVAAHSVLCQQLAQDAGENLSVQAACLSHDLAEAFVGDWQGPAKPDACRLVEHIVEREIVLRGWPCVGVPMDGKVKQYDQMSYEIERMRMWPETHGPLPEHLSDWAYKLGEYPESDAALFRLAVRATGAWQ